MQEFSGSLEFAASADDTVALVATEEYMRKRYEEPDLLAFEMEIERDDDDAFECVMRRTFALTDGVPKMIRRVVGSRFTMIQEHRWTRKGPVYASHGTLRVDGAPGEVKVNVKVEPLTESTCQLNYNGTISAGVPIIGKQIEKFLLERVDKSVEASFSAMAEALQK